MGPLVVGQDLQHERPWQARQQRRHVPVERARLCPEPHAHQEGRRRPLAVTGSENNNNGNDRNNALQIEEYGVSYPMMAMDVSLFKDDAGEYHFMSVKNNAYSNLSQKGTIIVEDGVASTATTLAFIIGGVAVVGAGGAAALVWKKKSSSSGGRF